MYFSSFNGTNWTVDELVVNGGYLIGASLDLELNNSWIPYIAYYDDLDTDSLKIMSLVNGSWTDGELVSYYSGYYDTNSNSISMKFDSADNLDLSYYYRSTADLYYAYRGVSDSSFTTTSIDTAGSIGMMNSLALDSNDNPHIAYYDGYDTAVKYAYCTSTSETSSSSCTLER